MERPAVGGDRGQKIELAPLGGKWDGAKLYSSTTHQRFEVGKDGRRTRKFFSRRCATLVNYQPLSPAFRPQHG